MVHRHRHHRNISVQQLPSPYHRTSNRITLAREADVAVFGRPDHSANSINHKQNTLKIESKKDFAILFLFLFRLDSNAYDLRYELDIGLIIKYNKIMITISNKKKQQQQQK